MTRSRWRLLVGLVAGSLAWSSRAQDREYGPPHVLRDGALPVPSALAISTSGRFFVLDTPARRILQAELDPVDLGAALHFTPFAEGLDASGPTALIAPQGLAVDSHGIVYVADTIRNVVQWYELDAATGAYVFGGRLSAAGPPADPRGLSRPRDVALGPDDSIYVLDSGNQRVLVAASRDAEWHVYGASADWKEPYGLAVAPDGSVYVADTGNHRIVHLAADGTQRAFGAYGSTGGALRYPRDVAVGPDGRLYVTDTHNHRIAVFDPDGHLHRSLGVAALLGRPEKLAFDAHGRLLVADPVNGWIVAWPGSSNPVPAARRREVLDAYLRDELTDGGAEPSATIHLQSPDVLVRRQPDIDLARAAREGLASVGDDPPVYDRPNYVYFELRNQGRQPLAGGALAAWTSATVVGSHAFPSRWQEADFFRHWTSDLVNEPGNALSVPFVPGRADAEGRAVIGPLVWRPGAPPGGGTCRDERLLMARLVDVNDPIVPANDALQQMRASNNVAVRRLPLVPASCVPPGDRFEENDRLDSLVRPPDSWRHLHERCPPLRGLHPDPDARCPGVFENGSPLRPAPPSAEERWDLVIPNLSLHGTTDRDFFAVRLPDLSDHEWRLDDINTVEARTRGARHRESYVPRPMPECGVVERQEWGPGGRPARLFVNVSTELLIVAEPTDRTNNTLSDRPAGMTGEALRIYRDGEWDERLTTGSALVRRITCPASRHGLAEVDFSFGERRTADGALVPRALAALGGYQIRLTYRSSITRGIPEWARDANDARGVRDLPCGTLPICRSQHPQTPGLVGCLADGPGCLELSRLEWPSTRQPFELILSAGRDLQARVLGPDGKELARSVPVQGRAGTQRLKLGRLAPGAHFLEIKGAPTSYVLQFGAPEPPKRP